MSNVISAAGAVLLYQDKHRSGFQVLLLKRNPKLNVHGGHWVFPGGKFDTEDFRVLDLPTSDLDCKHPHGLSKHEYLQVAQQAALRETQEEAGITLDKQDLKYCSRWLTPKTLTKRFDTCFFIAEINHQHVVVDGSEIVDHKWVTPLESLTLHQEGKISMPPATFVTLSCLSKFTDANTAIIELSKKGLHYRPKLIAINQGLCSLYEEDAGYEHEEYQTSGKRHRLNMISGRFEYLFD